MKETKEKPEAEVTKEKNKREGDKKNKREGD